MTGHFGLTSPQVDEVWTERPFQYGEPKRKHAAFLMLCAGVEVASRGASAFDYEKPLPDHVVEQSLGLC